ncbi:MAG: DoxX family protein [Burkholderiaceae bacterium]|nr:DoxX family protein [Burkholderiaceae bacterium]
MKTIPRPAPAVATLSESTAPSLRERWYRLAALLTRAVPEDLLLLATRVALAAIFWQSGRTKVDGGLTVSDTAVALFGDEYKLPLLPPEVAAQLAAYAEHLFPLLLVLGLATRVSALALLGMTATIQIFVYPDAWPTHLSWAALMLLLVRQGGGAWSLDRLLARR